jgi:hypothetical protein
MFFFYPSFIAARIISKLYLVPIARGFNISAQEMVPEVVPEVCTFLFFRLQTCHYCCMACENSKCDVSDSLLANIAASSPRTCSMGKCVSRGCLALGILDTFAVYTNSKVLSLPGLNTCFQRIEVASFKQPCQLLSTFTTTLFPVPYQPIIHHGQQVAPWLQASIRPLLFCR